MHRFLEFLEKDAMFVPKEIKFSSMHRNKEEQERSDDVVKSEKILEKALTNNLETLS